MLAQRHVDSIQNFPTDCLLWSIALYNSTENFPTQYTRHTAVSCTQNTAWLCSLTTARLKQIAAQLLQPLATALDTKAIDAVP